MVTLNCRWRRTMGPQRHGSIYLKLLLVVTVILLNGVRADTSYDTQIQRSKRNSELLDDENQAIGDALYDDKHAEISKREEIAVPSLQLPKDDVDISVQKDTNSQQGSRKSSVKKYNSKNEHFLKPEKKSKKASYSATVTGAPHEDARLLKGMDSNVDHPMGNPDITKQYDASRDTENGEMMGISDSSLPDDTETHDIDRRTYDTQQQTLSDAQNTNTFDIVHHDIKKRSPAEGGKEGGGEGGGGGDAAPSHFQVDDKSADLEINANSAGVKVKAKPASLQVVSRPGAGPMAGMPPPQSFIPPPDADMYHYHHKPHHHRHHRHHHRHNHFLPGLVPSGSLFNYGGYGGVPMHPDPYISRFMGMSHYNVPWGMDSHYPSPWGPSPGYGRSTVEGALDPRLSSEIAMNGFNTGIALPESDNIFADRLRNKYLTEDEQLAQEHLQHIQEATMREFSQTEDERRRQLLMDEHRYHTGKWALPDASQLRSAPLEDAQHMAAMYHMMHREQDPMAEEMMGRRKALERKSPLAPILNEPEGFDPSLSDVDPIHRRFVAPMYGRRRKRNPLASITPSLSKKRTFKHRKFSAIDEVGQARFEIPYHNRRYDDETEPKPQHGDHPPEHSLLRDLPDAPASPEGEPSPILQMSGGSNGGVESPTTIFQGDESKSMMSGEPEHATVKSGASMPDPMAFFSGNRNVPDPTAMFKSTSNIPDVHSDMPNQISEADEAAKEDKEFAKLTQDQDTMYKKLNEILPVGDVPRPDLYPTEHKSPEQKNEREPESAGFQHHKSSEEEDDFSRGYKKDNLPETQKNTTSNSTVDPAPKQSHGLSIEISKSKSLDFKNSKDAPSLKTSSLISTKLVHNNSKKSNVHHHFLKVRRDIIMKTVTSTLKHQKTKEAKGKKKNDIIINRPPVIYHPPPEIYHRPAIVLHRPPIMIQRPSIIYHQPPVVVHRPAVIYRQPPLIFHQPPPIVHQPFLRSHDKWMPVSSLKHVSSQISNFGTWAGIPSGIFSPPGSANPSNEFTSSNGVAQSMSRVQGSLPDMHPQGMLENNVITSPSESESDMQGGQDMTGVPAGNPFQQNIPESEIQSEMTGSGVLTGARKSIIHKKKRKIKAHHKTKKNSRSRREAPTNEKEGKGTKKDVVVNRPPIIYHPPPEIYHRPDIVIHRPPIVIHRPPIIYHQPPVIVHRPAVVYHQPPIVFHQPPPAVQQPLLYSHDTFVVHPSFVAQHLGSVLRTAHHYIGPPRLLTELGSPLFRQEQENKPFVGPQPQPDRPQPPPQPDQFQSFQPQQVGPNEAEVRNEEAQYMRTQPSNQGMDLLGGSSGGLGNDPGLMNALNNAEQEQIQPIVNERMEGNPQGTEQFAGMQDMSSAAPPIDQVQGIFKRSLDAKKSKHPSQTGSKRQFEASQAKELLKGIDKGSQNIEFQRNPNGGHDVIVHRPGVLFNPPPEIIHRPNLIIHRAPLLIQRAPIVVHQAPVVIHRPQVLYHQPDVIFHTPPPMVQQPRIQSSDMLIPTPGYKYTGSQMESAGAAEFQPRVKDMNGLPNQAISTDITNPPLDFNSALRHSLPGGDDQHPTTDEVDSNIADESARQSNEYDNYTKDNYANDDVTGKIAGIDDGGDTRSSVPKKSKNTSKKHKHHAKSKNREKNVRASKRQFFTSGDGAPTTNELRNYDDIHVKFNELNTPSNSRLLQHAHMHGFTDQSLQRYLDGALAADDRGEAYHSAIKEETLSEAEKNSGEDQKDETTTVAKKQAIVGDCTSCGLRCPASCEQYNSGDVVEHVQPSRTVEHVGNVGNLENHIQLNGNGLPVNGIVGGQAPLNAYGSNYLGNTQGYVGNNLGGHHGAYLTNQVRQPYHTRVVDNGQYRENAGILGTNGYVNEFPGHVSGFAGNEDVFGQDAVASDVVHPGIVGAGAGNEAYATGNGGYAVGNAAYTTGPGNTAYGGEYHSLINGHLNNGQYVPHSGVNTVYNRPDIEVPQQEYLNRPDIVIHRKPIVVHRKPLVIRPPPMVIQKPPVVLHQPPVVVRPVIHSHRVVTQHVHHQSPCECYGKRNCLCAPRWRKHIENSKKKHHVHHAHTKYFYGKAHTRSEVGRHAPINVHGKVYKRCLECGNNCDPGCHTNNYYNQGQHGNGLDGLGGGNVDFNIANQGFMHSGQPYFANANQNNGFVEGGHPMFTSNAWTTGQGSWDENHGYNGHSGWGEAGNGHGEFNQPYDTTPINNNAGYPPQQCNFDHHQDNCGHPNQDTTVFKRPDIVVPQPPDVIRRPDIVIHRAPIIVHRRPIVYHQAPVIVHKPPVVVHQAPIVVHPVVHHHRILTHHVHDFQVQPQIAQQQQEPCGCMGKKDCVCAPSQNKKDKVSKNLRSLIPSVNKRSNITAPLNASAPAKESVNKTSVPEEFKTGGKKKKDVVVSRPPIIYHPPPEIYHRPDIVVHRPPLLIHRPSIIYHQPPVIVHRPAVVYHQPPLVFHQPPPAVQQPLLVSHDTFRFHPSAYYTHMGSVVNKVGSYVGVPHGPIINYPHSPYYGTTGYGPAPPSGYHGFGNNRVPYADPDSGEGREPMVGMTNRPETLERGGPGPMGGPPHEPEGQEGFPHPPGMERSPINEFQRPPSPNEFTHSEGGEMEHQEFSRPEFGGQRMPGQFENHEQPGFPMNQESHEVYGQQGGGYERSFSESNERQMSAAMANNMPGPESPVGHLGTRDFGGPPQGSFKRNTIARNEQEDEDTEDNEDDDSPRERRSLHHQKQHHERAGRKNKVVVGRPDIVYHQSPEIVHRPPLIVHRPDIVIHRPSVVVHRPPVVVHRPAIMYHQPPVIFNTPPPVVHQPNMVSHDMYVAQNYPHRIGSRLQAYGGSVAQLGGGLRTESIVPPMQQPMYPAQAEQQQPFIQQQTQDGLLDEEIRGPSAYNNGLPQEGWAAEPNTSVEQEQGIPAEAPIDQQQVLRQQPQPDGVMEQQELPATNGGVLGTPGAYNEVGMNNVPAGVYPQGAVQQAAYAQGGLPNRIVNAQGALPADVGRETFGGITTGQPVFGNQYFPGSRVREGMGLPTRDERAWTKSRVPHHHHHPHKRHFKKMKSKHLSGMKKQNVGIGEQISDIGVEGAGHGLGYGYARHVNEGDHGAYATDCEGASPACHHRDGGGRVEHVERTDAGAGFIGGHDTGYGGGSYGDAHSDGEGCTEHQQGDCATLNGHTHAVAGTHATVLYRPDVVFHPRPELYHRPDIIVHRPDVVIHRPSVVIHQPPVLVHRPAVIVHQPPIVFHQPPPVVHRPRVVSHDQYVAHPHHEHVGSQVEHTGHITGPGGFYESGTAGVAHAIGGHAYAGDDGGHGGFTTAGAVDECGQAAHNNDYGCHSHDNTGVGHSGITTAAGLSGTGASEYATGSTGRADDYVGEPIGTASGSNIGFVEGNTGGHTITDGGREYLGTESVHLNSNQDVQGAASSKSEVTHHHKKKSESKKKNKHSKKVRRDVMDIIKRSHLAHKKKKQGVSSKKHHVQVIRRPDVVFHQRPEVIHRPDIVLHRPDVVINRPDVVIHRPALIVHKPPMVIHQPPIVFHQSHPVMHQSVQNQQNLAIPNDIGNAGTHMYNYPAGLGPQMMNGPIGYNNQEGVANTGHLMMEGNRGAELDSHNVNVDVPNYANMHHTGVIGNTMPIAEHTGGYGGDFNTGHTGTFTGQNLIAGEHDLGVGGHDIGEGGFGSAPGDIGNCNNFQFSGCQHNFGGEPVGNENLIGPIGFAPQVPDTDDNGEERSKVAKPKDSKHTKVHKKKEKHAKAAKKHHVTVIHRPDIIYHPKPEIVHRPDVIVHRPDVVIHRPSVVVHRPPVIIHKPPVVIHQSPIVFHQPNPVIDTPIRQSHDYYNQKQVPVHVGSQIENTGTSVVNQNGVSNILPNGVTNNRIGNTGLNTGINTGLNNGINTGLTNGIETGLTNGISSGINSGFNTGINTGVNTNAMQNIVNGIAQNVVNNIANKGQNLLNAQNGNAGISYQGGPDFTTSTVTDSNDDGDVSDDARANNPTRIDPIEDAAVATNCIGQEGGSTCVSGNTVASTVNQQNIKPVIGNTVTTGSTTGVTRPNYGYGATGHGLTTVGVGGDPNGGPGDLSCGEYQDMPHCPGYKKTKIEKGKKSTKNSSKVKDIAAIKRCQIDGHCSECVGGHCGGEIHDNHGEEHFGHHGFGEVVAEHFGHHDGVSGHGTGMGGHHYGAWPGSGGGGGGGGGGYGGHSHGGGPLGGGPGRNHADEQNIVVQRPDIVFHPRPELYHRPDIIVHRPDIVIHRPSVVIHQPPVLVHRPAVIYHQPPVVFHQPGPVVHRPRVVSHDMYVTHDANEQVGSQIEHADGGTVGPGGYYDSRDIGHGGGGGGDGGGGGGGGGGGVGGGGGGEGGGGGGEGYSGGEGGGHEEDHEDDHHHEGGHGGHGFGSHGLGGCHGFGGGGGGGGGCHDDYKRGVVHPRHHKAHHENATKKHKVVVFRPPIIYHPPAEIYHRADLIVHRPDVVIRRPSVVVHRPPVVVHRPNIVYHQPPVVFYTPPPNIHQPVFKSHDSYVTQPMYQHVGSNLQHVGGVVGQNAPVAAGAGIVSPNFLSQQPGYMQQQSVLTGQINTNPVENGNLATEEQGEPSRVGTGLVGDASQLKGVNFVNIGGQPGQSALSNVQDEQTVTNGMETPEGDQVEHVQEQEGGVPVDPNQQTADLNPQEDTGLPIDTADNTTPIDNMQQPTGQPTSAVTGYTKSKVEKHHKKKHNKHQKKHRNRRDTYSLAKVMDKRSAKKEKVTKLKKKVAKHATKSKVEDKKKNRATKKTEIEDNKDKKKATKKNDIVVKRPPVIYHPPPEIYHRPPIIVHRPPLVIRRPPIIYHQPPVIVHRPAVVYHQPPLIFHQPPPAVSQPILKSHDTFMMHPAARLTHMGSMVTNAGTYVGVPEHRFMYQGGMGFFNAPDQNHPSPYGGAEPEASRGEVNGFTTQPQSPMEPGMAPEMAGHQPSAMEGMEAGSEQHAFDSNQFMTGQGRDQLSSEPNSMFQEQGGQQQQGGEEQQFMEPSQGGQDGGFPGTQPGGEESYSRNTVPSSVEDERETSNENAEEEEYSDDQESNVEENDDNRKEVVANASKRKRIEKPLHKLVKTHHKKTHNETEAASEDRKKRQIQPQYNPYQLRQEVPYYPYFHQRRHHKTNINIDVIGKREVDSQQKDLPAKDENHFLF